MPARIVLVLSEPGFADRAACELVSRGYDAIGLTDSMAALDALEGAEKVELLVTCEYIGPHKPSGLSLARMTRFNRPDTKVLFIGAAEIAGHVEGLGVSVVECFGTDGAVD